MKYIGDILIDNQIYTNDHYIKGTKFLNYYMVLYCDFNNKSLLYRNVTKLRYE